MSTTWRNASDAAAVLFTLLVVTPICGYLFGCGCDWAWRGLFVHCASFRGIRPGCPWCEHPALGLVSIVLPIAAGIACARAGFRFFRRRGGIPFPSALALAEFSAAAMGVLGALAGLVVLGALTPLVSRIFPL